MNEHFADGIQDDVLTNLAKVRDLKVISRTSVMSYRGKVDNIRETAGRSTVLTVLEGSVRDGNRVRAQARVHLMCGDKETALSLLEGLVAARTGVTVYELRIDPTWDALRQEARFRKMAGQ